MSSERTSMWHGSEEAFDAFDESCSRDTLCVAFFHREWKEAYHYGDPIEWDVDLGNVLDVSDAPDFQISLADIAGWFEAAGVEGITFDEDEAETEAFVWEIFHERNDLSSCHNIADCIRDAGFNSIMLEDSTGLAYGVFDASQAQLAK